jgi:hypothetical protein
MGCVRDIDGWLSCILSSVALPPAHLWNIRKHALPPSVGHNQSHSRGQARIGLFRLPLCVVPLYVVINELLTQLFFVRVNESWVVELEVA